VRSELEFLAKYKMFTEAHAIDVQIIRDLCNLHELVKVSERFVR
jgi:hypothetical protein